jgi:pimeloyl-ACP methyl ester carboxylesterase
LFGNHHIGLGLVMPIPSEIADLGEDGFADSSGVKIHYVTRGAGPLVILLHGIPGFWFDWRNQMPALARHFQVAAIDQRGFNLSDKPEGVEHYTLDKLVGDVDAVVQHFGRSKAIVVGHDSGGWISWHYAMAYPDKTDRLIVVNLPHPACIERELADNPRQYQASDYSRQIQGMPPGCRTLIHEGATHELTPELYASGFTAEHRKYLESLRRTSIESMLNFYKANYPRPPYRERTYPPVKCPVLMIHGLADMWLMPETLNNTWRYLESELTLVTVPGAGHWVHVGPVQAEGAPDLVTKRMVNWLRQDQ